VEIYQVRDAASLTTPPLLPSKSEATAEADESTPDLFVSTTALETDTDTEGTEEILPERVRKTRLFKLFTLLVIGQQLLAGLVTAALILLFDQKLLLINLVLCLAFSAIQGLDFIRVARRSEAPGRSKSERGSGSYTRGERWRLVASFTAQVGLSYLELGTAAPLVLAFLVPIAISVVLADTSSNNSTSSPNRNSFKYNPIHLPGVLVTGWCACFTLGLYLAQDFLGLYTPLIEANKTILVVIDGFLLLLVMPVVVALLVLPARSQNQYLSLQLARLSQALLEITSQQKLSRAVSIQAGQLSGILQNTATAQASASTEQVAVVTQVGGAVRQLSTSASTIAQLAEEVEEAAGHFAQGSQRITQAAGVAAAQSEAGLGAIKHTVRLGSEVAILYQDLIETLTALNQKSQDMSHILDLIKDIAAQTHLLSLNAKIEAASASGENGDRFRVVAQAVKELAQHSGAASQQVATLVREVSLATTQARDKAQGGYHKAQELEGAALQAGQVIERLAEVAVSSYQQAQELGQRAVEQVQPLSRVILRATIQQRTTQAQVAAALGDLIGVAEEGAKGARGLEDTALRLREVAQQLTATLVV